MEKIKCDNCKRNKRQNSFFASNKRGGSYSKYCKSCHSILSDFKKPGFEDTLTFKKYMESLRPIVGENLLNPLRNEISHFQAYYETGHWMPAIVSTGRIGESIIFSLTKYFDTQNSKPKIDSLRKLEKAIEELAAHVNRQYVTRKKNFNEHKIIEQSEKIVKNSIELNLRLKDILESKTTKYLDDSEWTVALWHLDHFLSEQGTGEQKKALSLMERAIRKLMKYRNEAAHPDPSGKNRQLYKRHLKDQRKIIEEIFKHAIDIVK